MLEDSGYLPRAAFLLDNVMGLAAREVAVGALGTVYALSAAGDNVAEQLAPVRMTVWRRPGMAPREPAGGSSGRCGDGGRV